MPTNITKPYSPSPFDIAAYVESLKISLKDGEIKDKNVADTIENMPSPIKIRSELSYEECFMIFETVRWAWKEITGQDITNLAKVSPAPETLMGNYWMLKNGLIFHGVNHYTIVKQNIDVFAKLLNINAFVIHEKLSSPPEQIIKTIIDNGGVRVFITKDKRAYFQMNDKIYGEWGRNKVKKLDFKDKIVKLIDKNIDYSGWKSGITILL